MGCAGSSAAGGDDGGDGYNSGFDPNSNNIDEQLEAQNKEENAIVKLLVLGTGESGKSTVFKQMKILYSVPDPPAKFIFICRANLFGNAGNVADGMTRLGIEFKSEEGKAAAAHIASAPSDGNIDDIGSYPPYFKKMYEDEGVKEAIARANEYQLNDSTIYFWERADELCKTDYMPSEQDVLRARVRTTGIVQQNFQIEDKKYTMFDVGGQRNERRKWIHCFDNVTAVIFVTAVSEYDQVLYEDETTNRMDEALVLFDQICNHASFKETSMILFLNKRDLFEIKLKKKDMTCWKPNKKEDPEIAKCGQDYELCIAYVKKKFLELNKDPLKRQVYVHATCATDTENISFVMESVFDIILKDNLRKLAKPDVTKLCEIVSGTGNSTVSTTKVWEGSPHGKTILAVAWFTDNLESRLVLSKGGELPAVSLCPGTKLEDVEWAWVMGLGKDVPLMPVIESEKGSFKGSIKEGVEKLASLMGTNALGSIYDLPIRMTDSAGNKSLVLVIGKKLEAVTNGPDGFTFVDHESFENKHYKAYDGKDTDASPCKAPAKGEEFNPFAANPVGFRWFKGLTLYMAEVLKKQPVGVYLAIFKVCSTTEGFKIMVNEHNRIQIPTIFLTETQLTKDELTWMHGVRVRADAKIDLLEGKKPNRGWLGPEMSGEEGATFPEKLWWAIDEGKARLDTDDIGFQYDKEIPFIDEANALQLLIFGTLAKDENDILPGHIWVNKEALEVQSMKYLCPIVLQKMLAATQSKIVAYQELARQDAGDLEKAQTMKEKKKKMKADIEQLIIQQEPLKWINRVIMWCADKMPSFAKGIQGDSPAKIVELAMAKNSEMDALNEARTKLIDNYMKS